MMTANAHSGTFASPDTHADASACKRAVFLPTHPSPPTTLDNSLTRSFNKNRRIEANSVSLQFNKNDLCLYSCFQENDWCHKEPF